MKNRKHLRKIKQVDDFQFISKDSYLALKAENEILSLCRYQPFKEGFFQLPGVILPTFDKYFGFGCKWQDLSWWCCSAIRCRAKYQSDNRFGNHSITRLTSLPIQQLLRASVLCGNPFKWQTHTPRLCQHYKDHLAWVFNYICHSLPLPPFWRCPPDPNGLSPFTYNIPDWCE